MSAHIRHLRLPLSAQDIDGIVAGDLVTLSGEITVTIGLPTHQRMVDRLEQGEALPVDLVGGAFLHLSSYNREFDGDFEVLYLNPTTSTRYDLLMPQIIRSTGLRVVGGKGGLGAESVAAMQDSGCIYLSFLGGGCSLLSRALRRVVAVHWPEYISQFRLVTLEVERLGPATVAIDAHGRSLYADLRSAAEQRLPGILQSLTEARTVTEQGKQ